MKHVIIIGAGPAGLMAAYAAQSNGATVTLLEKNDMPGKKLLLTGNGRCNVTNNADRTTFINHIMTNGRFLYSALSQFDQNDMINLLHENGIETKVEDEGRVFPKSNQATDVWACLLQLTENERVTLKTNASVSSLIITDGICQGVIVNDEPLYGDAVIVATGGLSYPGTGATGDGYRFAKQANLKVTDCTPALVSYNAYLGSYDLQGLTLKDVTIKYGKSKSARGSLLFTHYGVSGPVILSLSSRVHQEPLPIKIDLFPQKASEHLEEKLAKASLKHPNGMMKNILRSVAPSRMIPLILDQCDIPQDLPARQLSQKRRRQLADALKNVELTLISKRGYDEAMVTQGGVDVKAIDPATMQVKTIYGLFFAGEVLDVDGLTGGYNLQIAWTTGYTAGQHASQS